MKKTVSLLMVLVLFSLLAPVTAFASPIGRVLPQEDYELHDLVGQPVSAYEDFLAARGVEEPSGVRVLDDDGVITGFYLSKPGFSLYGNAVHGRQESGLVERMEGDGWATLQNQFEGGLRFYTFEKTTQEGIYTFRMKSSDYVISSVSLDFEPASVRLEEQLKQGKELFSQGYAYESGKNGEKDDAKALEYYLRSAELGCADAYTRIGLFYRAGRGGLEDNDEEAIKWLRKADEMGDNEGMYYYAEMCMNGEGVERSYEEGLYWYEYAARRGSYKAQYMAGMYYYEGRVVEQDLAKAREMLMLGGDDLMHGAIELLEKIDAAENK